MSLDDQQGIDLAQVSFVIMLSIFVFFYIVTYKVYLKLLIKFLFSLQ